MPSNTFKLTVSGVYVPRPSPFQRYYICRVSEGYTNNNFCISGRFNKPVHDVLLSHALKLLIEKNPVVLAKFDRGEEGYEDGSFTARPVNKLHYDDVVEHWEAEELGPELLERIAKEKLPVDIEKPSWKLLLIKFRNNEPQTLTFVCNHIIFDGNAAANFFDELVQCLGELEKSPPTSVCADLLGPNNLLRFGHVEVDPRFPLYEVHIPFFAKLILKDLVPRFLVRWFRTLFLGDTRYKYPDFDPVPLKRFNNSGFRILRFTPEETSLILSRSKELSLTLTPFIGACAYLAAQQKMVPYVNRLQGYEPTQQRNMEVSINICGRRFEPGLKKELKFTLCVGEVLLLIVPELKTVQAVGDELKKDVEDALVSQAPFKMVAGFHFTNVREYLESKVNDPSSRSAIEISNLGRKNFKSGSWEVTDLIFSQGVSFSHACLSVISTPKGGLNIVLANVDDMEQWKENGEKVMDDYALRLEKFLMFGEERKGSYVSPVKEAW